MEVQGLRMQHLISDLVQVLAHGDQVVKYGGTHGEDATEFAGARHFDKVYGAEVDSFEAEVPKRKHINTQIQPLIPPQDVDGDAGVQRIQDQVFGAVVEDNAPFGLLGVGEGYFEVEVLTGGEVYLEDEELLD